MRTLEFEMDVDKWTDEVEVTLRVGKDYWIASPVKDFINGEHSEVQIALIGMLASKKETYDSLYEKVQEAKVGVASHACRGEKTFKLKL